MAGPSAPVDGLHLEGQEALQEGRVGELARHDGLMGELQQQMAPRHVVADPAHIPPLLSSAPVRRHPRTVSDLHVRPPTSAEVRPIRLRDAEAPRSNPGSATTNSPLTGGAEVRPVSRPARHPARPRAPSAVRSRPSWAGSTAAHAGRAPTHRSGPAPEGPGRYAAVDVAA